MATREKVLLYLHLHTQPGTRLLYYTPWNIIQRCWRLTRLSLKPCSQCFQVRWVVIQTLHELQHKKICLWKHVSWVICHWQNSVSGPYLLNYREFTHEISSWVYHIKRMSPRKRETTLAMLVVQVSAHVRNLNLGNISWTLWNLFIEIHRWVYPIKIMCQNSKTKKNNKCYFSFWFICFAKKNCYQAISTDIHGIYSRIFINEFFVVNRHKQKRNTVSDLPTLKDTIWPVVYAKHIKVPT